MEETQKQIEDFKSVIDVFKNFDALVEEKKLTGASDKEAGNKVIAECKAKYKVPESVFGLFRPDNLNRDVVYVIDKTMANDGKDASDEKTRKEIYNNLLDTICKNTIDTVKSGLISKATGKPISIDHALQGNVVSEMYRVSGLSAQRGNKRNTSKGSVLGV